MSRCPGLSSHVVTGVSAHGGALPLGTAGGLGHPEYLFAILDINTEWYRERVKRLRPWLLELADTEKWAQSMQPNLHTVRLLRTSIAKINQSHTDVNAVIYAVMCLIPSEVPKLPTFLGPLIGRLSHTDTDQHD